MEHQLRMIYQHVSALNPVPIQVSPCVLILPQPFPRGFQEIYMWVLRHLDYFMSKSQSCKIFTPPPFDISVMAQETSNKIWHTSWTRCCCRRFSHSSPGIFTLLWYSANRKELYGSPNGTFWQETSWHWRRPTNHGRG